MFCIIRLDAHFGTNPQNLKIQHFWERIQRIVFPKLSINIFRQTGLQLCPVTA